VLDPQVVIYMASLTAALVFGILFGYLLRNKKHVNLNKVTMGVIVVLIFSLGFSIGSNNELLGSLPQVGLNAIVIVLLAIGFSVAFVKAAGKVAGLK
jgi:hypothetical protein